MFRNEYDFCLLCNSYLKEQKTWKHLFSPSFTKTICKRCESKFERFEVKEEIISLYRYNDAMKDYVHRYKFMKDVLLAKVFREEIFNALKNRKEMIVPIPIHPQKKKERTFAHVDELLKASNISFQHVLEKKTNETQGEKSREERLNTPQLFKLKKNADINNKEILLVDDIYTTGTTIKHAKTLLLNAGARKVSAFTLIRSEFY